MLHVHAYNCDAQIEGEQKLRIRVLDSVLVFYHQAVQAGTEPTHAYSAEVQQQPAPYPYLLQHTSNQIPHLVEAVIFKLATLEPCMQKSTDDAAHAQVGEIGHRVERLLASISLHKSAVFVLLKACL